MKKKILIANDDASIVSLMSSRLHEKNYEVVEAFGGLECVQIAQREDPDLILIDILMPNGGGIRAFEQLIQFDRTRNIPIIFMITVLPTAEIKDLVLKMGANGCISMLFTSLELEQAIQMTIGNA